MSPWNERTGWLVHGDVTIGAQPEDTKIDWPMGRQPPGHQPAFSLGVTRIAPKSKETICFNGQWSQKFRSEVSLAARRMVRRDSTPFIEL